MKDYMTADTITAWATVAAALAAAFAAYCAHLQAKATKIANQVAKFDKRFAIFHATRDYLQRVLRHGQSPAQDAAIEWSRSTKGHEFLFDDEIRWLIDAIWEDATELDRIIAMRARDTSQIREEQRWRNEEVIVDRMKARLEILEGKFRRYLDLRVD